jgi:hypothetical protein
LPRPMNPQVLSFRPRHVAMGGSHRILRMGRARKWFGWYLGIWSGFKKLFRGLGLMQVGVGGVFWSVGVYRRAVSKGGLSSHKR